MKAMSTKIATLLLALVSAVGLTIVAAPAANAAGYGCSGSLIDSYPVVNYGSTWGHVYLYYSSSTGKNCAVTVKNSNGYEGTATDTAIFLDRCTGTTPGHCGSISKSVDDQGYYSYYAGPVSLYAAGHCIQIIGSIWGPSHTNDEHGVVTKVGVHCG